MEINKKVKGQIIFRAVAVFLLLIILSLLGLKGKVIYILLSFFILLLIFSFIYFWFIRKGIWVQNEEIRSKYSLPIILVLNLFYLLLSYKKLLNIYTFLISGVIVNVIVNYLDYKEFCTRQQKLLKEDS